MRLRAAKMAPTRCLAVAAVVFSALSLSAQSVHPGVTASAPKTAEQVYKNIQVLVGVPVDQLVPAMQFITASLGVQCDFCHLENAFEKDDKENKQTARKMMRMMFALNKDNFDGHREVTCYSCHRGANKPLVTPAVSDAEGPLNASPIKKNGNIASLPTADGILEKYLQSVGGTEAVNRISTRIQQGTLAVGEQHFPVEVLAKAPAMRVTTVHFPTSDSITGFDGAAGWLSTTGNALHEMSRSEIDDARLDADLHFPVDLRKMFNELRVEDAETIDGHETSVVQGIRRNQPPVQLCFDKQSGFLVRQVRYTETPLGRNPTQIDYADYRAQDGVMIPFRWTIAHPGGRFTIQIDQMQQNVPIEDEKFVRPAASVKSSQPSRAP